MARVNLYRRHPLLLIAWLGLGSPVWAGPQAAQREVPGLALEAPLRNDTFQPTDREAQEKLLEGDRAWREWRASGDESRRTEAFEAWRAALVEGGSRSDVSAWDEEGLAKELWEDPERTLRRRSESLYGAVQRRLEQLREAEMAAWRERFEPLAAQKLAEATDRELGRRSRWERTYHEFPATSAGASAALRLGDSWLEEGRSLAAWTWLGRAEDAAPRGLEAWVEAIRKRRKTWSRALPTGAPLRPGHRADETPASAQEAWTVAQNAELLWSESLQGIARLGRGGSAPALGREVSTGLAFLEDGSFVIQGPEALGRFEPQPGNARPIISRFALGGLVEGVAVPYASDDAGGWPQLPATDGSRVLLVSGRSRLGGGRGNALLFLDFPPPGAPRVLWRLGPEEWARLRTPALKSPGPDDPSAEEQDRLDETPLAKALLREGPWEFQPGPLLVDGRVLVLARNVGREEDAGRIVLFCLKAEDGSLIWSREVTRAADLRPELVGLRTFGNGVPTPAQPLAWIPAGPGHGQRVFVGTNVGLGNLYDVLDGRLVYSLRSRRRLPERRGWAGSRRPPVVAAPDGGWWLAWAPFDSDYLYSMALGGTSRGVFQRTPQAIGAALGLVAQDTLGAVFEARDGARLALAVQPNRGPTALSLHLDRGERFAGTGLASAGRVWVATERSLLLFDRQRELALTGSWPLGDPLDPELGVWSGAARGGGIYGRGSQLVVVGADSVWLFQAED